MSNCYHEIMSEQSLNNEGPETGSLKVSGVNKQVWKLDIQLFQAFYAQMKTSATQNLFSILTADENEQCIVC